jgi:transposase InsO family protein
MIAGPKGCKFVHEATNKLVATGTRLGRLFRLDVSLNKLMDQLASHSGPGDTTLGAAFIAERTTSLQPMHLWHQRLGHLEKDNLKRLAKMSTGMTMVDDDNTVLCDACVLGKLHAKGAQTPAQRATERAERLHVDLGGPITPMTTMHEAYYLVVIDDLTRYTWICVMRRKSDTLSELRKLVTWIETQVGIQVKSIRSDNGGEFGSKECIKFYPELGIQ